MVFILPYIGFNHPNWLSYFSEGVETPNQYISWYIYIIRLLIIFQQIRYPWYAKLPWYVLYISSKIKMARGPFPMDKSTYPHQDHQVIKSAYVPWSKVGFYAFFGGEFSHTSFGPLGLRKFCGMTLTKRLVPPSYKLVYNPHLVYSSLSIINPS
jgi:hypothetical protein